MKIKTSFNFTFKKYTDRHEEWLGNKKCIVVDASQNFRLQFEMFKNIISKIDKQLHKKMLDHDPLLPPTELV